MDFAADLPVFFSDFATPATLNGAPVPYRGKRNEPAYVAATAAALAQALDMSGDELAAATTANARRIFTKLPAP